MLRLKSLYRLLILNKSYVNRFYLITGMLITGIVFKNVPVLSIIGSSIDSKTSSLLRNMAFCVILCRAGLSLDIDKLTKMKFKILKFSVIPCLVEAFVFALAAIFILKLSFEWALLMGFVLSGVSPSVVVPLMIQLQETGLGVAKNIPGFVIAASCIDNIIAITGHSLMIGIVFNQGEIWWTLIKCPFQVMIGILFGIILGVVRIDHRIEKSTLRFFLLFLMALIMSFLSKKFKLSGSAPLGILTMVIVAKLVWKKIDKFQLEKKYVDQDILIEEKIASNKQKIEKKFSTFWLIIFLPFLFSLIGNEIDFTKIDPTQIGLQLATFTIGLVFRTIAAFFSIYFIDDLNLKEKFFMSVSWIPKATVQAAISPIALDIAKNLELPTKIPLDILNIAVLSIIITAPLGALFINFMSKKLLIKEALIMIASIKPCLISSTNIIWIIFLSLKIQYCYEKLFLREITCHQLFSMIL
ncbi:mitochondrial sodium hydrogen exchanger 9B2-like [Brachionus plicatilis]|uniref:Mitochondrial sodium hydrogen exchanger 9B2-like n=1 Tax=Brachionus plicatilis TaxID=10195 RepID=A0A3M7SVF8_BRAPC|nr:mitochondrial sodium hydrogen exchanger 9B2-like [Brachionus plicatilis]